MGLKLFLGNTRLLMALFWVSAVNAQKSDAWLDELGAEFNEFEQQVGVDYRRFVAESDREFAEWLANAWQEYEAIAPEVRRRNKPLQPAELPGFSQAAYQHSGAASFSEKPLALDFFGEALTLPLWPAEVPDLASAAPRHIAAAWLQLSAADYQVVISDIESYCHKLECADWAKVLMVNDYVRREANARQLTDDQQALLTWFVLNKLGLATKAGRVVRDDGESLVVLFGSDTQVYDRQYFLIDGWKYYPLDPMGSETFDFYSYPSWPNAVYRKPLSFYLNRTLAPSNRVVTRTLQWPGQEGGGVTLKYDGRRIQYLSHHPQVEYSNYFMASPDPILAQSAKAALVPILIGKSDREIANVLLKLLQFGIAYQVDQEQFGQEFYMDPAQVLFYPAADCEDKVALFAQLFSLFSDAPVQALGNTQHVVAAIAFDDNSAPSLTIRGGNYWIADPTYIGAEVGQVMPTGAEDVWHELAVRY